MKAWPVPPLGDRWCERRSGYYMRRLPHVYTTRRRLNDGPWRTVCSWCGKAQRGET